MTAKRLWAKSTFSLERSSNWWVAAFIRRHEVWRDVMWCDVMWCQWNHLISWLMERRTDRLIEFFSDVVRSMKARPRFVSNSSWMWVTSHYFLLLFIFSCSFLFALYWLHCRLLDCSIHPSLTHSHRTARLTRWHIALNLHIIIVLAMIGASIPLTISLILSVTQSRTSRLELLCSCRSNSKSMTRYSLVCFIFLRYIYVYFQAFSVHEGVSKSSIALLLAL